MPLRSESVLRIVDVLAEGHVEGLVGGGKGIYLDETPIIGEDGTWNFKKGHIDWDFKQGARSQPQLDTVSRDAVSNVVDISTQVGVNYWEEVNSDNEVTNHHYGAGIVVRQITDTTIDRFRCVFTVPKLYSSAMEGLAKGQLFWAEIRVRVYLQPSGEDYEEVYDEYLKGISTSNFQFSTPEISLKGDGPWNIKVRKSIRSSSKYGHEEAFEIKYQKFTDVDEDTPLAGGRGNELYWTSIVEIERIKTNYPYTTVVGLEINSEEFESLPNRAYLLKGRKVHIPHNAVVRGKDAADEPGNGPGVEGSLAFAGAFDGSLTPERHWTTCPICCFYDLLTTTRFGCGNYVDASNISWADLYPLCRYANELVQATSNTKEARFAINVHIAGAKDAYTVLKDLASVFRGMTYWASDVVQIKADHGNLGNTGDVDPVHLYTNSNVVEGVFGYSGSSLATRSTSILVRYNDPENHYKPNFVSIEKPEVIEKYGYHKKTITAFGCSSKYQARRLGRWMLSLEELAQNTVEFQTGLDGAVVMPGEVFAIADELRQGIRIAGRIGGADTNKLWIDTDQNITLPAGSNFKVPVVMPDGKVEIKGIDTGNTGTAQAPKRITVDSAFSEVPTIGAALSISSTSLNQQKFRCIGVQEADEDGIYHITGLEHNDSIYNYVENDDDLEFDSVSVYNTKPPVPVDVSLIQKQIIDGHNTTNIMYGSWAAGSGAPTLKYEIRYDLGGEVTTVIKEGTNIDIKGLTDGVVATIKVRSIGYGPHFKKSSFVTVSEKFEKGSQTNLGAGGTTSNIIPPDAGEVMCHATGLDQVLLSWKVINNLGVNMHDCVAVIKHDSDTSGTATWQTASTLTEVKAITNQVVLDLMNGEYFVKFKDRFAQWSKNAGSAVINVPEGADKLTHTNMREDQETPEFPGARVNCAFDSGLDGLKATDHTGSTYMFHDTIDLGGKFTVNLTRHLRAYGLGGELIDDMTALIDDWDEIDGDFIDRTSVQLYKRSSNNAILDTRILMEDSGDNILLEDGSTEVSTEADVNFGEWSPLLGGYATGRVFEFKAEFTTEQGSDQVGVLTEAGVKVTVQKRSENGEATTGTNGQVAVTFSTPFIAAPNVSITAQGLSPGDYFDLPASGTSITRTGFTVHFKNDPGGGGTHTNIASKLFYYQVVGFGSEE